VKYRNKYSTPLKMSSWNLSSSGLFLGGAKYFRVIENSAVIAVGKALQKEVENSIKSLQ
jgi:hypothetical protein